MSKSVELLAGSEDSEPVPADNSRAHERSRLNLNGSRQLSKSATELRDSEIANSSPSRRGGGPSEPGSVVHHHHHRHRYHATSVAQRTHTFFATLKSRWARSRSKERKKSKDAGSVQSQDAAAQLKNPGVESDYAADYSSEHSRSSSATQSPARHCLNHSESPLARGGREKVMAMQEDSAGKCGEGFSKGSLSFQSQKEGSNDGPRGSVSQDGGEFLQDEVVRKREMALRQHAFFQLRLHIRRGANLVAMDRGGASDPYVKVKCSGRLLHKSRTVHRDLNPVWDESVTLPIEDPFQALTIKVFDYDWGLQDDFMGAAQLDLTQLELGHPHDITLELKDPGRPKQHLGEIYLTATLWPRNQQEKEQEADLAGTKPCTENEPNVAAEMATLGRDSLDDVSKIESETRVMSDADKPVRKLQRKPHVSRQRRHPVTAPTSGRDASEKKFERNVDETESDSDKDIRGDGDSEGLNVAASSSAIEETVEEPLKTETIERPSSEDVSVAKEKISSAFESEKSDGASAKERARVEESARMQKRKAKDSLKGFIEKKIGLMERIMEDRVERFSGKIWEENVERHPWLQPIDTWISDHRKPTSSYTMATQCQRDDDQDVASKSAHNCETIKEDEEPRIDGKTTEHPRGTGSPRSNRLDLASLIAQSKKEKAVPTFRVEYREEDVSIDVSNDSTDVGEAKEARRHNNDLLDKLKDNVKEKMEDIHRYFQKTNRLADVNRRLKSQIWSSVVTIVLVEAKNLLPMDIDGLSDPYVKFRLGTEKYKSKVVNKTLNPVWLEQFDLHLYEDPYLGQELEVTVWDRDRSHNDDLMGRAVIDLATLERETTHRLWRELEDGSGNIFLLLTISGTTANETISDLAAHEDAPLERVQMVQRYSILNTLQRIRDVGHLTVKVYRAQGLAAADLGGKSDPFCVLELVNARLQTQTEYKTLAPNWQKIFTFNVKDINSVLEVTVYDEDRDHKVEFLGKVAIPLLKVRNGEKRWYALKDKKLRGRAKGNCPQILLEMTVIWNLFRACIRTLNPKEQKYMEPEVKFKRQVFLRNVLRLKAIIVIFIDIGKYIQSCWEWESKMRSVFALVIFIFGCYYFEPYMIPAVALLILLKYYLLSGERSGFNHWICGQVAVVTGAPLIYATSQFQDHAEIGSDDCPLTPGDDDDDDDDKDKEEKKSLKERLQAIQEVTQTVQNSIGYIASLCERVKNLFNFTIPYLSYLAMILAIMGAVVLYFIPVRYLILAWGVNKFSRKILRPHSVPNNELLDLISRVPDDEELLNYRELKPVPTADCEKGGISGSPGANTRREQRKRHKVA